jgi:hypothetical protein
MKKLESLDSKLFQEFKGDLVSELAAVLGGIYTKTKDLDGCEDTYKSANSRDRLPGNQSDPVLDIIHSTLSQDKGSDSYSGGGSSLSGNDSATSFASVGSFSSYFLG